MAHRLWMVALAVLTFWPALLWALLLLEPVHYLLHLDIPLLAVALDQLFPLVFATWALNVALIVYYLVLIYRGTLVAQADRAFWAVLVLLVGFVAMPVLYVRLLRVRNVAVGATPGAS